MQLLIRLKYLLKCVNLFKTYVECKNLYNLRINHISVQGLQCGCSVISLLLYMLDFNVINNLGC